MIIQILAKRFKKVEEEFGTQALMRPEICEQLGIVECTNLSLENDETSTKYGLFQIEVNEEQYAGIQADPAVYEVDLAAWARGDFTAVTAFTRAQGVTIMQLEQDISIFQDANAKYAAWQIVNRRRLQEV